MDERSQAPAGWLASSFLFGVPALIFWTLFHWLGPVLRSAGVSWLLIFHLLLIVPLACMLAAPFVFLRVHHAFSPSWVKQLRLTKPRPSAWLWVASLSGFMYGGDLADAISLLTAFAALVVEKSRSKSLYAAVVVAVLVKRNIHLLDAARSIRFFDSSGFYQEFFSRFGSSDFMGIPLEGAWWVLFYYAIVMLLFNIGGEELWWRGYVLPRQELAFGPYAWVVHGFLWSAFHLFMQPTLSDTLRMSVTGLALSFVAQRTRNTWPGIIGHSFGNLPFFLGLVRGVSRS